MRLAQAAGMTAQAIERHRFPDGELKLRLPVNAAGRLPLRVVLLRSLHQPNEKLVELLLAARTARSLGAQQLTLVAPYLAYMRQDIAFHPGEAVSQQVVGGFLAGLFDAVITVGVIEHVENPGRWLARLADCTRPGGLVSITSDTYIWRWLKQLGLYRSIQPLDDAIWPGTLIGWGKRAGLELVQCGGFVNVPEQRHHLGKELLRLLPRTKRLRGWLNGTPAPPMPPGEQAAIVEAMEQLEANTRAGLWAAVWSYESYYWFRKC